MECGMKTKMMMLSKIAAIIGNHTRRDFALNKALNRASSSVQSGPNETLLAAKTIKPIIKRIMAAPSHQPLRPMSCRRLKLTVKLGKKKTILATVLRKEKPTATSSSPSMNAQGILTRIWKSVNHQYSLRRARPVKSKNF